MDLLFIGLIFVGIFLSMKVITEGKAQIEMQKTKLIQYECATKKCVAKTDAHERKKRETLAMIEKLELELNAMKSKRAKVQTNIKKLKSKPKLTVK